MFYYLADGSLVTVIEFTEKGNYLVRVVERPTGSYHREGDCLVYRPEALARAYDWRTS